MTSTAKEIWSLIEEDVVVRRALEKGIVNMHSLAVHLMKEHKVNASADAVISAIRRYKEEQPLEKTYSKARKIIAVSEDIRITSNIVEIAVDKNRQTQELLEKAFTLVDYEKGEIFLIIQGEQRIKMLINKKNKDKFVHHFPKKSIVHIEDDLAEINIQLIDEATRTPGIISVLSTELMIHNIAMYEVMSCVPEMLFFVKQVDVVKAYEILFALCQRE